MRVRKKHGIAIAVIVVYALIVLVVAIAIDKRHAEISLVGSETMTVEFGTEFQDPGVEARSVGRTFGSFKIGKKKINVAGQVDVNAVGDYTLEYSAEAGGETASVRRTVRVVDTTPPTIELKHTEGYVCDWFTGYEEEGYTATDLRDGDITDKVQRTPLEDKILYTVCDEAGNEVTVERPIEYSMSAPEILLEGEENMRVEASLNFADPGYSARDKQGKDLTDLVTVSGSVTPYELGTYKLEYTIENGHGDKVSAMRTVEVVKAEKPEVVIPEEKTIYLTFDDGPGAYTGELLDILAAYNVKATFFVTGANSDYYDMIGRAYEEGHSIGVHTFSHNYRTIYSSEKSFFEDFIAAEELIYEQTGSYTKLCRFPGGSSNTVSSFNPGIMRRLVGIINDLGYCYYDWNVASGDAGETTSTAEIISNIKAGCRQNTVSVVLQHDIKNYSVAAVESVIQWGLENGYTFKALDQTSYAAHHGIFN